MSCHLVGSRSVNRVVDARVLGKPLSIGFDCDPLTEIPKDLQAF